MSDKLATHISEVAWYPPSRMAKGREPAVNGLTPGDPAPRTTAWLDELLDGGVAIPARRAGKGKALSILITGPSGSGKSTLALELAYRWSCLAGTELPAHVREITGGQPLQILYATREATAEEMIQNAASYQWKDFPARAKAIQSLSALKAGRVNIISVEDLVEAGAGGQNGQDHSGPDGNWPGNIRAAIQKQADEFGRQGGGEAGQPPERPPDVLLIDSVNFMPEAPDRGRFYQQYTQLLGAGPLMIIFVLGATPRQPEVDFWESAGDMIIRLDQSEPAGNRCPRTRNVEIVKARFQTHARGKHQLNIHPGCKESRPGEGANPLAGHPAAEGMRSRAYRTEGGIFIIPSAHFLMAHLQQSPPAGEAAAPPLYYNPKTPNLKRLIGQGFPPGQCTAMIGERGGHKSHLGYVELLYRLVCAHDCRARATRPEIPAKASMDGNALKLATESRGAPPRPGLAISSPLLATVGLKIASAVPAGVARLPEPELAPVPPKPLVRAPGPARRNSEKALVVSLRDDAATTRRTMAKILDKWREFNSDVPTLAALEEKRLLEIIYFQPGYITPDEFYHRVLLGINRLKHADDSQPGITLLFNSLDQLAARFPLCASEPVFIPGILQLLAAEQVSSFFVATREEGRPDYYGLGSMAEVILEFEYRDFPREEVRLHLTAVLPGNQAIHNNDSTKLKNLSSRQAVVVTLRRFAGGLAAGEAGILELLPDEASRKELELGHNYAAEDLIFIPRNPMQKGDFGFDARLGERPAMVLAP